MTAVVGTELFKAGRRLRTYVGYGIVAAIPIIITIVLKLNPPGPGDGPVFAYLGSQSGLLVPAFALRVTSEFLLVIVVALFAGDAIAGEANWGNLRYLLMRPVARGRLFGAKFVVALLYGWLAVAIVVVVGTLVGGAVFGFKGIDLGFSLFRDLSRFSQSTGDILGHLVIAWAYVSWFLTTVIAFSFMLGCMTDSPMGAILGGVGLWITFSILDAISSLGQIRYFLPTHWSGAWADMFTHNTVSDDMIRGSLLTLGYVVLFLGFGAWWFTRKDVLS